ncbi:hypothetical protein J2X88_005661 [Pseudomonas extremaustralis]|nr:hypothetical protein [Pseudomonas extremaustralis]
MNPIPVGPVSVITEPKKWQLGTYRPRWSRQIAVPSQFHEQRTFLRLSFNVRKSRRDFHCSVIHPTARGHHQIARSRYAARGRAAPLNDGRHWATQSPTVTDLVELIAPMLHEFFNFIDHRPALIPNRTQHKKHATQHKPYTLKTSINQSFNLNCAGCAGCAGFFGGRMENNSFLSALPKNCAHTRPRARQPCTPNTLPYNARITWSFTVLG